MSVTINLTIVGFVVLYIVIGGIFVWRMAISPQAIVILLFLWPLFLILIILSPLINYLANRNLGEK